MTSTTSDDLAEPGSGDLLVWILAWSELAAFGALLAAFVIASWISPDDFLAGRARLDTTIPIANTVVLIASGWFAAMAARQTRLLGRRLLLLAAAAGGFLFTALKIHEYGQEGASLLSNDAFSTLYVLITGFHLAHVLFGSCVLALIARFPSRENVHLMTTLWHVIDIVWLVMFPLVYLL